MKRGSVSFHTIRTLPVLSIQGRLPESPLAEVDTVTGVPKAAVRAGRIVTCSEVEPLVLIVGHVTAAMPARLLLINGYPVITPGWEISSGAVQALPGTRAVLMSTPPELTS